MRRILGFVMLGACGAPAPEGGGAALPPKVEPPAPVPVGVDAAACAAPLQGGPELGVWTADLDGSNEIVLHLLRAPGADAAAPLGPGLEVVGWAELRVGDLDRLLDVPTGGKLPDPGALCARSVTAAGGVATGRIVADDRSDKNVALSLVAPLPAASAAAVWGADAMKPLVEGEGSRLVPSFDRMPGGESYLLVRFGEMGGNGYPPALEPQQKLRGDAVITLVDGQGRGIYETHHMQ